MYLPGLLAKLISSLGLTLGLLVLGGNAKAQTAADGALSSPVPDTGSAYSFLVGGHLYGAHANAQSIHPAASFLSQIPQLNALMPNFMVSLGDLLRHGGDSLQIQAWKSIAANLHFPVLNAPGNHDLLDRAAYTQAFGPTQQCFQLHGDAFLLLDTELMWEDNGQLVLDFIAAQTQLLMASGTPPRNLFVFSHRLTWALAIPELAEADALCNAPLEGEMKPETAIAVQKAVQAMAGKAKLHWFSGDVGAAWSVPLLHMQSAGATYTATGLGDTPDDGLLHVRVDSLGNTDMQVVPLGRKSLPALAEHDLAWAKAYVAGHKETESTWAFLRSKRIWAAALLGFLVGALLVWWKLRRKA